MIALILIAVFRFLRFPCRLTFILTILLLIGYALLSGGRASVVRATIMAVIVLAGFLINREVKIYNSLGLAALAILIFNPNYLFDSGFQLSFLSVISIVYLAPKIEQSFSVHNRFVFYLVRAFSVSLAAWIGLVPLVAFYFNIVSPVAVLANLVVIPLLFLTVSIGVCFLIFTFLWVPLGAIFAQTAWLSLFSLTSLTTFIAKIPFGYFHTPKPDFFFFCGYYLLLLLIFDYKELNLSAGKVGITLALAANFLVWRPLFRAAPDKLTVTFFDVGHADAIFIQFPDQGTMLIDGGAGGENDAGRWVILPFLWNQGIGQINAVVLTHPDDDHVGGLATVLTNVKVDYVFDNGMSRDSASYNDYRAMLVRNVPHYRIIRREEQISGFPQVALYIIHPPQPLLTQTEADTNENSVVLKLVYEDVSFLFCADIQEQAIKQLLLYQPILPSSVIKVPHHGSDEGEAESDLFQAVSAQLAVISVNRNNRFGFPAPQVLERLQRQGTQVYTTGESGAVIVSTDGEDIWVRTMVRKRGFEPR